MIAVITPTIPERFLLLTECEKSVQNQTIPARHFIYNDKKKLGCAVTRNILVSGLPDNYDWLAFLDDDDVFLPSHLEVLSQYCSDMDIIYSDCRTDGWEKTWTTHEFDPELLTKRNYIPVTVLMRRSLFDQLGGFKCPTDDGTWPEDWDLWKRAYRIGARFKYHPEVTWVYKQHKGYDRMLLRGY